MRYTSWNADPSDRIKKLGPGLNQFTLCMWIAINFLRGRKTVFISFASDAAVDALYGAFRYDTDGEKKIEFCTYGTDNPLCVEYFVKDFTFQNPRHLCLTSTVTARQRRSVMFFDGQMVAEGKKKRFVLEASQV